MMSWRSDDVADAIVVQPGYAAFVPGRAVGIVGKQHVAVIDTAADSEIVESVSRMIEEGNDFDSVISTLIDLGLRNLPDLAVVQTQSGSVRALVRGGVLLRLILTSGEVVVVDSSSVHTWVEHAQEDVESLTFAIGGTSGADSSIGDLPFKVLLGIVPVSVLDVSADRVPDRASSAWVEGGGEPSYEGYALDESNLNGETVDPGRSDEASAGNQPWVVDPGLESSSGLYSDHLDRFQDDSDIEVDMADVDVADVDLSKTEGLPDTEGVEDSAFLDSESGDPEFLDGEPIVSEDDDKSDDVVADSDQSDPVDWSVTESEADIETSDVAIGLSPDDDVVSVVEGDGDGGDDGAVGVVSADDAVSVDDASDDVDDASDDRVVDEAAVDDGESTESESQVGHTVAFSDEARTWSPGNDADSIWPEGDASSADSDDVDSALGEVVSEIEHEGSGSSPSTDEEGVTEDDSAASEVPAPAEGIASIPPVEVPNYVPPVPVVSTQDVLTPQSSDEDDEDLDDDDYDHLFGATQFRPVSDAGVNHEESLDPEHQHQPTSGTSGAMIAGIPGVTPSTSTAETDLGDHDGMTISLAQLRAAAAAQGATDAPPVPGGHPTGPTGVPMVHAVSCPAGHQNPPSAAACRTCGVEIPDQPHLSVPRPVLGTLRFSTGEERILDGDMLLGRSPKIQGRVEGALPRLVPLESVNKELSGTHLEVRIEGWQVMVIDRHSTNGTTVCLPNREPQRLHPGEPMPIVPGTQVNMADEVRFTYEVRP